MQPTDAEPNRFVPDALDEADIPPTSAGIPSPTWAIARATLRGIVNDTTADPDAAVETLGTLVRLCDMVDGRRINE